MYLNRTTLFERFPGIKEGQNVYSSDGEKLGTIVALQDDHFIIEKGLFFPKEFSLRYDDITDFRDGSLYIGLGASELTPWKSESYEGWSQTDDINYGRLNATPREEFRDRYQDWSNEEIKVPLSEEKLEAQKTSRQAGEVKLRKVVHTELKRFTVPVMREEVRVERVPVSGAEASSSASSEGAFREETINVPVMEEEVTISKRPVVKEEVRVSKERKTEERQVEGEVRREDVRIEGEDDLKKRTA